MLHDEVGSGGAQLVERVVAGQHGAGMNAAMRAVSMSCSMSPMKSVSSGFRLFSRSSSWIFSRLSQTSVVGRSRNLSKP